MADTPTMRSQFDAQRLVAEYRPTMDREVLHSWARDVVAFLSCSRGQGEGWRSMDSAPKDGKHCILAIKVDSGFVYSAQGAFQEGKWNSCIGGDVEPLAWMPNVLLPDHMKPWSATPALPSSEASS